MNMHNTTAFICREPEKTNISDGQCANEQNRKSYKYKLYLNM